MTVLAGPLSSQGYDVYWRNTAAGCPYDRYTYSVYHGGQNENNALPVYNACGDASGYYKGYNWGQPLANLLVTEYLATICTPNWQCVQPLNGYEHDVNNCPGSVDRLNTAKCSPPIQYHNVCIGNMCSQVSGPGTNECPTLGIQCNAPPPPTTGCLTGQISLLGTCIKTSYLLIGGTVLIALMLLKKK